MRKLVLLLFIHFALTNSCAQDHGWKRIKILRSTRSDVERLLGKPEPQSVAKYAASYKLGEGRVYVAYSQGTCGIEPNSGWNVPDLTVTQITVYAKPFIPFSTFMSNFKLDESKFIRRPDPEIIHQVEYVNEADGISFTVDTDDNVVGAISYFPRVKDAGLRCSSNE